MMLRDTMVKDNRYSGCVVHVALTHLVDGCRCVFVTLSLNRRGWDHAPCQLPPPLRPALQQEVGQHVHQRELGKMHVCEHASSPRSMPSSAELQSTDWHGAAEV